jgi:hypothetical protein
MSLRAQRGNLVANVLPQYITVMHDDNHDRYALATRLPRRPQPQAGLRLAMT